MSRQSSVRRGFEPAQLDSLPRTTRRQLCQLLLVESGLRIESSDERADHDQFVVEVAPVWRARRALVQVFYRPVTDEDVDRLDSLARERGFADAMVIEAAVGAQVAPKPQNRVQLVATPELVRRFEESALVAWTDGRPAPSRVQFSLVRQFGEVLPSLDAIGLRWLVPLSLNKVPHDLVHRGQPADRLFEQIAFRVLTTIFRFGGHRLGSTQTGQAKPDAILKWCPRGTSEPFAALLDCKAGRDGFVMDRAGERALVDYANDFRGETLSEGLPLKYVVILSSSFPGERDPHPYVARAGRLRAKADVGLVYMCATDLLVLAVAVEHADAQPDTRDAIDWSQVFDEGLVSRETLIHAYESVKGE